MIGRKAWMDFLGVGVLGLALAACSQEWGQVSGPAALQQEEKTFAVAPDRALVQASFLTGELRDMRVSDWN